MSAIGSMERIAEQMEQDNARLDRVVRRQVAKKTEQLERDLSFMRTQALDLANQVNAGRTIIRELVAEINAGPLDSRDLKRVKRMAYVLTRAQLH